MKQVVLSPKARSFLLAEAHYLRQHSPRADERFLARLRQARRSLGRFEHLGFAQEALPIPGMRRLIVGDDVLDYSPGAPVVIVSIRHHRQSEGNVIDEGDDGEPAEDGTGSI